MEETERAVTRRAGIVGLGTLASRILGLARDSVIAALFNRDATDAFWVAFVIPNSFRRLTAEGAFSISMVSVFSKTWVKGDLAESRRFVAVATGFAVLFLGALTIAGMAGAEGLTWLAGQGFKVSPHKYDLAVSLTRWMFPYVMLVSLAALAMGVLNSAGRFFSPAFAPVLLNVATIACAFGLAGAMADLGLHPVYALAIGTLVGGAAQLLFQFPSLKALGLLVRPAIDFRHPGLRRVLVLTLPMVFGAAAYQVGLFISSSLASRLGQGAVTYIQFSQRLMELPLAVLVMAISTAALPSLSALRGEGRMDDLKRAYGHSLRLALFVTTPASVALVVLSEPIVTVLYQRGMFDHHDVLETAGALSWMAIGTCAVALVRQTVPVFYALENTRVPVVMTTANIVAYVAAALPLMRPFGQRGLCMALSIAAAAQGLGLAATLSRRIGRVGYGRIALSWLRMIAVSVPMALATWGLARLGRWEEGGNSVRNIVVLATTVVAGLAVYGIAAWALGVPELHDLASALGKRLDRRKA